MIFDRDDTAYIATSGASTVRCAECAADDREQDMTPDKEWLPGVVVDVWRCPACGHTVTRGEGNNERFV